MVEEVVWPEEPDGADGPEGAEDGVAVDAEGRSYQGMDGVLGHGDGPERGALLSTSTSGAGGGAGRVGPGVRKAGRWRRRGVSHPEAIASRA
jgi:hypothetical protein